MSRRGTLSGCCCDEFQGYLIGHPCPEAEMRELLEHRDEHAARMSVLAGPVLSETA